MLEVFNPIASTNIAEFRYDDESEDLEVDFVSGGSGVHRNVPVQTYRRVCAGPSVGGMYAALIKGRYVYERR